MNENKLWIEVREDEGGLEAKLCDLRIAARGNSKEQLLQEITHSLVTLYEVATELNETPFLRFVVEVPLLESVKRANSRASSFGEIDLPHQVSLALSSVLRMANPLDRIPLFKAA